MSAAKPFRVVLSSEKDWLPGAEIGGWILEPSWTLIRHALTPFWKAASSTKSPRDSFGTIFILIWRQGEKHWGWSHASDKDEGDLDDGGSGPPANRK